MIRFSIIFVMMFHALYVQAIQIPEHIIKLVHEVPQDIEISHKKLSEYLSSHCEDESEKVLAFSYWIAKNIRYSIHEVRDIHRTDKTAFEVLRNKKAVCEGYSILFQQMCEDAGILSYVVYGHGYGNFFRRVFNKAHMRHAWNAVYCNEKWYILDITWAAREIKDGAFKETGQLNWIFCDPSEFAKSHYPNDPRWQLLDNPVSKREFWTRQENITQKNYATYDSLNILLQRQRYRNEMIICKSEFLEQNQKHRYLDNLIHLGWKYVNGFFDEQRILNGIEIFDFAKTELEQLKPAFDDLVYQRKIEAGKKTANNRMQTGK